jgi:hypothetical protein
MNPMRAFAVALVAVSLFSACAYARPGGDSNAPATASSPLATPTQVPTKTATAGTSLEQPSPDGFPTPTAPPATPSTPLPTFVVASPTGWPTVPERLTAIAGDATPDTVSCGGQTGFPASVVDDPNPPSPESGPQLEALKGVIEVFGVDVGVQGSPTWRWAGQQSDAAEYISHVGDRWVWATIRLKDGKWIPAGFGDCQLTAVLGNGLGPAEWTLNPAFPPPTAQSTELQILVWELACSGGQPATGRMSPPLAEYEANQLTMTIGVTPVGGGATCPGPPGTPVVVTLPQPLGDRTLLDGHTYPPSPPTPSY